MMVDHICPKCRKPLQRGKIYGWTCGDCGGTWHLRSGRMWPVQEHSADDETEREE